MPTNGWGVQGKSRGLRWWPAASSLPCTVPHAAPSAGRGTDSGGCPDSAIRFSLPFPTCSIRPNRQRGAVASHWATLTAAMWEQSGYKGKTEATAPFHWQIWHLDPSYPPKPPDPVHSTKCLQAVQAAFKLSFHMETTKCSSPEHVLNSRPPREQSLEWGRHRGCTSSSRLAFLLWRLQKMHWKCTFDRIKGIRFYIP